MASNINTAETTALVFVAMVEGPKAYDNFLDNTTCMQSGQYVCLVKKQHKSSTNGCTVAVCCGAPTFRLWVRELTQLLPIVLARIRKP